MVYGLLFYFRPAIRSKNAVFDAVIGGDCASKRIVWHSYAPNLAKHLAKQIPFVARSIFF